MDEETDHPDE